MADSRPNALAPGTVLHEYRIEAVLGDGAFGITYKAQDTYLGIAVAIKEYFPDEIAHRNADGAVEVDDPDHDAQYRWGLQRFVGEAQVLAQFKHPNIVRVSRYFAANGTAYIVMDYEEGRSLTAYLKALPGPPDEAALRNILLPLLEGLREVHRKRYLHRDIKPGNVYIRDNDSPILLDFGAAKLEMATSSREAAAFLTPGYAPVEQYGWGDRQGPQIDLYALGATMYRCICGERPPEAADRLKALEAEASDPMRPAVERGQGRYSRDLLQILDWMLKVRPDDRPASASEILRRIRPLPGSGTTTSSQRRATQNYKLVFGGPVGAGKTTAVAALSDVPPVRTESKASDMAGRLKPTTTVAMDYGWMALSETERVHLYGAPGQERFDFMWDILQKGSIGLVLLIDNSRRDPFKDLDLFLYAFRGLAQDGRVAIGITRSDVAPQPGIEDYHAHLREAEHPLRVSPPVFEVDARRRRDVAMLVQALLYSLDPGVEDYDV